MVAPAATPAPAGLQGEANGVLAEMNAIRARHGLRPLRSDARLARASRAHVLDLLARNVFEHGDVFGRLRRSGAPGPLFGENLAMGPSSDGPRQFVRMWMNSPPHRRNLLRPGWRRVGIGLAVGPFSGMASAEIVAAAFAGR
jgi:uncharacterized protein YkwD